ncbi:MAG: hypothetical protein COW48_05200, partial [Hydrogenophilales bacterium CG17_big_fil_post_rev_8_21_14_2_50_63_12]
LCSALGAAARLAPGRALWLLTELGAWAGEGDLGAKAKIPYTIRTVLAAVSKPNTAHFPYPWLDFIERQRSTLLVRFLSMFETGT